MYILKNAITSIIRNKGRNILIGIIIIVISSACAITLAIRNSAVKIVGSYEKKYEIEETIGMDRRILMESLKEGDKSQEEMINAFNEIKPITVEEIKNYGESKYLKIYYYYYETSVDAKDIKEATDSLVKETTKTETNTKTENFRMPPNGFPGEFSGEGKRSTITKKTTTTEKIFNERAQNGAFQLKGFSSLESMSDFVNGKMTIVEGSVFTEFENTQDGYGAIISEELASLNELSVGDTITLENHNKTSLTYEIKIIGIYSESSETTNDMTRMFTNSANTIIVPSILVEKMKDDYEDLNLTVTPTFIVRDKDSVELFESEVKEKGLSDYYAMSNNLEVVEGATKSISNVKNFATTFLIITLIIGSVVLLVINMINIRERKYEIGVLRTIGMKKLSVISQFMIELLIVAVIGLGLGALIGATSSVNIANNLLENEISNSKKDMENIGSNFGGKDVRPNFDLTRINGMVNIDSVDSINAVVDITVLLELLGIGVLLTIISSISAGIAIARFSPLTILKERS